MAGEIQTFSPLGEESEKYKGSGNPALRALKSLPHSSPRMPLDLSQQDALIQAHPEVLLDRRTISRFLDNFVASIPPGLTGFAADSNGGQGGSHNSDSFPLIVANSTLPTLVQRVRTTYAK